MTWRPCSPNPAGLHRESRVPNRDHQLGDRTAEGEGGAAEGHGQEERGDQQERLDRQQVGPPQQNKPPRQLPRHSRFKLKLNAAQQRQHSQAQHVSLLQQQAGEKAEMVNTILGKSVIDGKRNVVFLLIMIVNNVYVAIIMKTQ